MTHNLIETQRHLVTTVNGRLAITCLRRDVRFTLTVQEGEHFKKRWRRLDKATHDQQEHTLAMDDLCQEVIRRHEAFLCDHARHELRAREEQV